MRLQSHAWEEQAAGYTPECVHQTASVQPWGKYIGVTLTRDFRTAVLAQTAPLTVLSAKIANTDTARPVLNGCENVDINVQHHCV